MCVAMGASWRASCCVRVGGTPHARAATSPRRFTPARVCLPAHVPVRLATPPRATTLFLSPPSRFCVFLPSFALPHLPLPLSRFCVFCSPPSRCCEILSSDALDTRVLVKLLGGSLTRVCVFTAIVGRSVFLRVPSIPPSLPTPTWGSCSGGIGHSRKIRLSTCRRRRR